MKINPTKIAGINAVNVLAIIGGTPFGILIFNLSTFINAQQILVAINAAIIAPNKPLAPINSIINPLSFVSGVVIKNAKTEINPAGI